MIDTAKLKEEIQRCTRCGNCQYFCPSYTVSRLESYVARGRLQLIRKNLEDGKDFSGVFVKRIDQCLLCGSCAHNCPAGVVVGDIIKDARELFTERHSPRPAMEATAGNIGSTGNISGDSRENRLLWFQNMAANEKGGGPVKVNKPAEYLYFAGCVSTLYPSSYSVPQTFASLLNKAGLDWSILGEKENCCAYPLVIGGRKAEAKKTAEENVRVVTALGVRNIVTTCPSCYYMWRDVYPKLVPGMPEINILHGTQLLAKLAKEGAFKFRETDCTVTFHDPCDLGRKCGVYDEPREVLKSIPGVRLAEMRFNRDNAVCCGGGGNLEMNDSALSGNVARLRISQALDTKADIVISSCQQCRRTLMGGARQMRARIKVMDLSEFAVNALE
ncbi:MAG: (Fe-S)-binding protein [Treponema sp.]|nr:(Fe-S)-binding protein [Treponema sp.]